MSTRATYQFLHDDIKTTIYIHHDGYPEGAAQYLYDTLCQFPNDGFVESFIRTNLRAEITLNHDYHGDTDYKYDIEGNGPDATIKAHKITYNYDTNKSGSEVIFFGKVHEFFEKYIKDLQGYSAFRLVQREYGKAWYNLDTAKLRLKQINEHTSKSVSKYNILSHNDKYLIKEANYILDEFPEAKGIFNLAGTK